MTITLDSFKFVRVPEGTGLRCSVNIIGIGSLDGCLVARNREKELVFLTPTTQDCRTKRKFHPFTLDPKVHSELLAMIEKKYGSHIIRRNPEERGLAPEKVDPSLGAPESFDLEL